MKTVKGLAVEKSDRSKISNPYFSNPKTDYIYRANIEIYGTALSGMLIIKKINDSHRIVFTTEFGNKIFDFELSDKDFKINEVDEKMNKRLIINTLRDDFYMMLNGESNVSQLYKTNAYRIYYQQAEKYSHYFFINAANRLDKIIQTNKYKERVIIDFGKFNDNQKVNSIAERISIQHKNIKLNIELTYLAPN